VSAASGALNGTYTIQVDSVGSSTTALSDSGLTTVTDPTTGNISSSNTFTLTVNGTATTVTPSGTSLESLADAINAASDGVQATIVNVGSDASPDYRLAVTSSNLGADTIQLTDSSNNQLLDTLSTGSDAKYIVDPVNGTGTEIESTSSQVTLSPGLTVSLLEPTTSPVTITVSSDYSALSSALSNFASAYNAALTSLYQQRGQSGGALTGESIVYSLTDVLNSISTYTQSGSGSVGTLADLGLTLDSSGDGNLDFNASTFSAASPVAIQQFLGSIGSSGFLQTANNALNAMTDPNTGVLQADGTALQTQITSENSQIAAQQTIVSDLETNLQSQLSQADAAIATLQAQTSYYTQLFNVEYGNNSGTMSGG
jgi:flagellar hook-associated protein 2